MAYPAQHPACSHPEARSDHQPKDAPEKFAVVDLADARDKEGQNCCRSRFAHRSKVNTRNPPRKGPQRLGRHTIGNNSQAGEPSRYGQQFFVQHPPLGQRFSGTTSRAEASSRGSGSIEERGRVRSAPREMLSASTNCACQNAPKVPHDGPALPNRRAPWMYSTERVSRAAADTSMARRQCHPVTTVSTTLAPILITFDKMLNQLFSNPNSSV